jgi:DNA polymerase zeta
MFIAKVRYYDPDMLTGYEVQNASWGYLVERGVELGIFFSYLGIRTML